MLGYFKTASMAAPAMVVCLAALAAGEAWGQQGYGSFYQQNVGRVGGQGPGVSPNTYLYNQYFYNRPSVSPYMNLSRRAPPGTTAYQAYVRPEQQRRQQTAQRQASSIAARKQQGLPGGMPTALKAGQPKRQASPYYNQWYGNPVYR